VYPITVEVKGEVKKKRRERGGREGEPRVFLGRGE